MKILSQDNIFRSFVGVKASIVNKIIELHFDDGTFLIITPDHKVMTRDGYKLAKLLRCDDLIISSSGEKRLIYKEVSNRKEYVFDPIEVEDTHNFIANDTLVHQCVFLDEFAFVNKAEEFYTSTYPVISSGKDTKVIITSTPNGIGNMFYKIWEGAITRTSQFKPFSIKWSDVPGRDEAWKKATIANTSELQFSQEYDTNFIGSSSTLISSECLLGLISKDCVEQKANVKYFHIPEEGCSYIMTVDVSKGRGQDYSTFTIFNTSTTPFKQAARFRDNNISPLLFPDIIFRNAKLYNNALVIIENNDAGAIVCNTLYYEYEYENTFVESSVKSGGIGCTMTKRVKRIGCSNLKDILESGKLEINDSDTIQELTAFESKGSSYEASGNNHDDLVMNLVMFSWFISTDLFDKESFNLKELLYSERLKEMEEDVISFGIMPSSLEDDPCDKYIQMKRDIDEWNLL